MDWFKGKPTGNHCHCLFPLNCQKVIRAIMWLKTVVNHPPVITTILGAINHSQSWVHCFDHIIIINNGNIGVSIVIGEPFPHSWVVFFRGNPSGGVHQWGYPKMDGL